MFERGKPSQVPIQDRDITGAPEPLDAHDTKGRDSDLWTRLQAGKAQTVGAQKTIQLLERILLPPSELASKGFTLTR